MAADGTAGTKNQPQFLDGGAPDLANDNNILANYTAKVGNRRVGTTAERNAAAGKDVWEGLEWFDSTLDRAYTYRSGSWRMQADYGYREASTAANGVIGVSHQLGVVPGSVQITGGGVGPIPGRLTFVIGSRTTSGFDVVVYRQYTGDRYAQNPVGLFWEARP